MKKIMVIDDSPTIRISVEYALKSLGLPVLHAENGEEALSKLDESAKAGDEVVFVCCDINMPVMDGIAFIKEFRKNDRFTPVIVLTTESEENKISEGKDVGASGWIVKPFQPDALLKIAQRFIK